MCSWDTTEDDVDRFVEDVRDSLLANAQSLASHQGHEGKSEIKSG
jgi:hypothetical protein